MPQRNDEPISDVGSGEPRAQQIGACCHGFRHHIHDGIEIAISERRARRLGNSFESTVRDSRLEDAGIEKEPFDIDPAQRVV